MPAARRGAARSTTRRGVPTPPATPPADSYARNESESTQDNEKIRTREVFNRFSCSYRFTVQRIRAHAHAVSRARKQNGGEGRSGPATASGAATAALELAGAGGRRASVTAETEKRAEGVEGRESLLSPRRHLPRCRPWIYAPQSHRRVPPAMPRRRRRRRHCVCRGVAGQLAGARGSGWRTPWSAPPRRHTASHGSRVCKGRQVHAGSRGIPPPCSVAVRNVVPAEHATACRMRRQKHSIQALH